MNKSIFKLGLSVAIVLFLVVGASAADTKVKPKAAQQELSKDASQNVPDSPEEASMTPIFQMRAGEEINWQVISGGGSIGGTSTNYGLSGTVSQTAVGGGTSDNFGLSHGFWQELAGEPPCDCIPGDANGDMLFPPYTGGINVGDAVYVINYVFKGGPGPTPYPVCSGDANGDCSSNVGDAVYLINYVFKGGPPPVTCEEWRASCGELHK